MDAIELRHELHKNPELAFQEYKTQKILRDAILKLGYKDIYDVHTGLVIKKKDLGSDDFVLLRAEMDGLPIVEETGWEHSSHNFNMHACGHDFHMATLYNLMNKIKKNNTRGNFLFVFQPAEETGGGALKIIDFLEKKDYKVKAAIAMHITDEYEKGTIASRSGILFASSCEVDLLFKGKAAHAAFNYMGKDAIKASVLFLNEIYNRDWGKDNLVWFGKISGGNARNIVADRLKLEGTVRSPNLRILNETLKSLEILAKRIERLTDVKIELSKGSVYRQVEVDKRLLVILKEVAKKSGYRFIECEMKLTGEDFGYFSQKYPTLMFWFGCRNDRTYGLHNPKFLPDDSLIEPAADILYKLVMKLL